MRKLERASLSLIYGEREAESQGEMTQLGVMREMKGVRKDGGKVSRQ